MTTPSSAMSENLFVRTITPPSMDNPSALDNSALESERKRMPASAPPEVRPHAYVMAWNMQIIRNGGIDSVAREII